MNDDSQIKKLSTSELIKNIALNSDNISLNLLLATRKLFILDDSEIEKMKKHL